MAFDFSKLKELNELEFDQVAIWPKEIRIVVGLFVALLVATLCYFLIRPRSIWEDLD